MARSHARISVNVWTDDDYGALTMEAQWLYVHILAHPRLSLCGVLDLRSKRWARLPTNITEDVVEAALEELVAAGYLLIDSDEEEVMVRTFTLHDIAPGRMNKNLAVGFWRAYDTILSADLRAVLLRTVPGDLWEKLEPFAPPGAASFRRSPRLEPDVATERCDRTPRLDVRTPEPEAEPRNPDPNPWSQSDSREPVDNPTDALKEPGLRAVSGEHWGAS